MSTVAELLRRAERRAQVKRVGWSVGAFLVVAALLAIGAHLIHARGVEEGRALEQGAQLRQALQKNADQLRLATVHRDSTKKEAGKAVASSASHRDTSRATVAAVHVANDSQLVVGALPPITMPRVAINAYLDLKEGRARDSTTIESLKRDVAAVEEEKRVLVERDSLHVGQRDQAQAEVKTVGRRRYWAGVKAGVVGTVAVLGAIAVLIR